MSTLQRILFFFVLPIISPLFLPPQILQNGFVGIIVEIILFAILGFFLLRGQSTALTLTIFIQGLNAIVRIMMLFPRANYTDGTANFIYIFTSLVSIALSIYLVLRLDRVDVRTQMVK